MSNNTENIEDIIQKNPIILFDGVCNLCDSSVQLVIKNDSKNIFKFSPLQSSIVKEYLQTKQPSFLEIDSIFLITPKKIYTESSAALTIAKNLRGFYPLLYVFYVIPKPLRDLVYSFIAKKRYKWYGKKESCMIPSKELKNKFL